MSSTDLIAAQQIFEAPTNPAAEWSVLARMLSAPSFIAEAVGVPLEQRDFSSADTRLIYTTTVERYFANESIDPLVIGEHVRERLASLWNAEAGHCVELLVRRVRQSLVEGDPTEHAQIVKRLSVSRQVMERCYGALAKIHEGKLSPEEVGDQLSTDVLQVTSGAPRRSELLDWMDTGREYVRQLQRVMTAREQGIEVGVFTGLPFFDRFTSGIGPGELCFLAGDPGVGKTAVAMAAALGFASRQLTKDPARRVGTLVISLEMTAYSLAGRLVSTLTGIDAVRLREGTVDRTQLMHIMREWKNRENLPLHFNFASNFRLSQLRALVAEAIRRHNVGFVVIDHFRMIDTDRIHANPNQEDEAKVRFLNENLAKDLNVAVMCLAHTSKVGRGQGGESVRPRLTDLRGSGMIAAHAAFVAFLYDPYRYMSDEARLEMGIFPGDMELLWEKNRFGRSDSAQLKFEAETMTVLPR